MSADKKAGTKKGSAELIGWVLSILLATIVAYYPSLFNGFVNWDDESHVTRNPMIQSLDSSHLKEIFTTNALKTYVPLSILSFAVEYHLFKLNPFYYHLDNLLLHLTVVLLLFFFAMKLGLSIRAAGLASLLFAIHPTHVEAVAWVSARKDVLYSSFYILALINYLYYLEKKKKVHYALTLLFGLLSLLAKAMALSLPLILLLCDWFYERKDKLRLLIEKIPFFLYILPLALLTFRENYSVMKPEQDLSQAVLIFIWTSTFYIKHFFFPWNLSAFYEAPEPISLSNQQYFNAVLIMILCIYVFIRYRLNRWVIFAFMFYFLSMFFLFRFGQQGNLYFVADRFMYLSGFGFCLLIGRYIDDLEMRGRHLRKWASPVLLTFCAMLGIILMIKSNFQTRVWKDSITFWTNVTETSPGYSVAYSDRGISYRDQGFIVMALKDYSKAIQMNGKAYETFYNRGNVYFVFRQYDLAIQDYTTAIQIFPQYPSAYNNRGIVYSVNKDYKKAVEDYSAAIRIDPDHSDAYFNRGNAYYFINQWDLALEDFNQAILKNDNFRTAYVNRAAIYQLKGQYDLALKDYDAIIRKDPLLPRSYFERSTIYAQLKMYDQAVNDALKAQALGFPDMEKYLSDLKKKNMK